MAETPRLTSFGDLPSHLILEVLVLLSGRLTPMTLVNVESTSKVFGWRSYTLPFTSVADHAASLLCCKHPIFVGLSLEKQNELVTRCEGNWKRVLRFLKSVVESWDMAETSRGNMKITTVPNATMVIKTSKVYSNLFTRVPAETRKYAGLRPIELSFSARVIQVSARQGEAAFVMQSGEVFTCGRIHRGLCNPKLVEALRGTPCKQVAIGFCSTVFLTREGHVYTVGRNTYGELGHGDTILRIVPTMVELLKNIGPVVQIAAGPFYVLAVTEDGDVYSFGEGTDLCLGHGDIQDKLQPHVIQAFKTKGVRILRVCAGDQHAAAIDSNGYVYTWGKGISGVLGHGDENDKPIPEVLLSFNNHLAVQVSASLMNTFVVVEGGKVYAFGRLGFGTFKFRKVESQPRALKWLRAHRVLQVSSGSKHTVMVTEEGRVLGFGSNRFSQLGQRSTQLWIRDPTEVIFNF